MNFSDKLLLIPLFIVTLTFGVLFETKAQNIDNFQYKELTSSLVNQYYKANKSVTIPENAYFLSESLKSNATVEQNTRMIQESLTMNDVVVLPNFPVVIAERGIKLKSGNVLIFQPKSQLTIEANSLKYYELLKIHDIQNVKVYNARLSGDRKTHKATKGEWGYGISIRNSQNVLIENFYIDSFWGDGIAIGYGTTRTSRNVSLIDGVLDNNRRNGLSVMNVDGLRVSNLLVTNTNGIMPMFGIDFEPNNPADQLNNIVLNNIYTYNNANGGLMLTFSKLKAKNKKLVSFTLNNFKDSGSPYGLMLAGVPKGADGLYGRIILDDITLHNNRVPITGRTVNNDQVSVSIENLIITNPKNKNVHHREIKRVFDLKKNYSINFKD